MKTVKFNKNIPCIPLFYDYNTNNIHQTVKEDVDNLINNGFEGIIIINYINNKRIHTHNSEIVLNFYSSSHALKIKTITKILKDKITNEITYKKTWSEVDNGYINESDYNYICYLLNEEFKYNYLDK